MKPTTLTSIASILGTTTSNNSLVTGAAVDSRLLQPGNLFFALPGSQVDGHSFLGAAAAAGASGAVVHRSYHGPHYGLPLLPVDDVLSALQHYAKKLLEEKNAQIAAVTGSLGKTTVKEFISHLLKKKYKVSSSPGNSNSQIGLPLAVINHVSEEDEIIVLEMGMTHPGQILKLINIAPPDIAVVTKVALAHAENFDSLEDIGMAKAEIFSHCKTKLGIYHLESNVQNVLGRSGSCLKQTFSTTSTLADYTLESTDNALQISEKKNPPVNMPALVLPGLHNQHNFLAAAAVARYFGLSWEEIAEAQATLQLPERRLQIMEKQGVLFVNDAYNASELSMKAALDSMPEPKAGGRKIAFLGGMVELGKFSEGCHREVGKHALERVDMLFCFGTDCLPMLEEWQVARRPIIWTRDREELSAALGQHVNPGDVVLLKGSRAKGVWKVLDEVELNK